MKKGYFSGILLTLLLLLAACGGEVPKEPPEVKKFAQREDAALTASGFVQEADDMFTVKHHIKGKDVYFECLAKGVSFRNNGAKIILYVDGQRWQEARQAAFIAKGLPQGRHTIKLELIEEKMAAIIAAREMEIEMK